jgi:hypothetical protein
MKKYLHVMAVLSLVSTQVFAQGTAVDAEVDAELNQMYGTRQAPQAGGPTSATVAPKGQVQGGQPIYILNQATPTAQSTAVQKQPTTVIEATPLTKSRADQIREARQQVEAETETKIVEKLEQSRMEDEKRRADVLFGEKFNNMNQPAQQPAAQPTPVAPVPVVVAPAPVAPVAPVAETPKEDTREVVREELKAQLDAEKAAKPEPTNQKYFTALAGVGEYPDVSNVRGNYLLGAAFGNKYDNSYAVEGGFTYSNYSVDKLDGYPVPVQDQYGNLTYAPPVVDVIQYSASVAVKYYLLDTMVKPIVGGLAQYSYRTFSWSDTQYSAGYNAPKGSASSQAIDLGIITGADFEFSPKFTIGADFRYLFNVSSRVTTDRNSAFLSSNSYGTPIEKLQYWNMSLAARVNF